MAAGAAGVIATVAFAAPANACWVEPVTGNGQAECLTDGSARVTWIVKLDDASTAKFTEVSFTPSEAQGSVISYPDANHKIAVGQPVTQTPSKVQQVTPVGAAKAELHVVVQRKQGNNWVNVPWHGAAPSVDLHCSAPSHPASSQPPTSSKPATTPPGSGVASASSTAPALPVTGSNTAIMAGAAVVLVGAGAGLFLVARRRRVRFTA